LTYRKCGCPAWLVVHSRVDWVAVRVESPGAPRHRSQSRGRDSRGSDCLPDFSPSASVSGAVGQSGFVPSGDSRARK
jgi:hypothetical protein